WQVSVTVFRRTTVYPHLHEYNRLLRSTPWTDRVLANPTHLIDDHWKWNSRRLSCLSAPGTARRRVSSTGIITTTTSRFARGLQEGLNNGVEKSRRNARGLSEGENGIFWPPSTL